MKKLKACVPVCVAAMLIAGCALTEAPRAVIPTDATCSDLLFLHRDAVAYARETAGTLLQPSAMGEARRIEGILREKGCVQPD